ncbi:MAG: hypothetical protein SFY95_02185, partial [Planctomycetota bacterium]|nr:hypothetical protein [Planctomycetota bacterium]
MMDINHVKELIKLMKEHDLTSLDLSDENQQVRLRRGGSGHVVNHQPVIYNGSGPSVMPQMPGAGMMMPMMAAAPA